MIKTVLVVCVGNICRSPLGERLLQAMAPHLLVSSAGIGALVGKAADPTASEVAATHDITLDGHIARQFSAELGKAAELILVMEPGHKAQIARKSPDFHQIVFDQIEASAKAWAGKLTSKDAV